MTLLEMILAISLLVMMIGVMFGFYNITLRARDRGKRSVESTQLARAIGNSIAEEIRGACSSFQTLGPGIHGSEHEITIHTVVLPDQNLLARRSIRDKPLPAQCDQRQVRYYIGFDMDEQNADGLEGKNLGLVRREIKTFRQVVTLSSQRDQVDTDLLAAEIRYLRFRYFDGVDWINKWHVNALPGQNSLPQAVEVTVGYDELAPPDPETLDLVDNADGDLAAPGPFRTDRFTVVARIPQADTFFGSRLARAQAKLGSEGLMGGALSGSDLTAGSLFDDSSSRRSGSEDERAGSRTRSNSRSGSRSSETRSSTEGRSSSDDRTSSGRRSSSRSGSSRRETGGGK